MNKILIVSGNEGGTQTLTELLRSIGLENLHVASSGAEARHKGISGDFDLILINMPLQDETGKELAFDFADMTNATVVTLLRSGHEEIIGSFGRKKGIYIITKPLNRKVFQDSVKFTLGSRQKLLKLMKKNAELTRALEELKAVSKAKCLLIANEAMDEPAAHRYIEQTAMNHRLTKRQTAEKIINASGIPGEWKESYD